jgi:hypothetical protein
MHKLSAIKTETIFVSPSGEFDSRTFRHRG